MSQVAYDYTEVSAIEIVKDVNPGSRLDSSSVEISDTVLMALGPTAL